LSAAGGRAESVQSAQSGGATERSSATNTSAGASTVLKTVPAADATSAASLSKAFTSTNLAPVGGSTDPATMKVGAPASISISPAATAGTTTQAPIDALELLTPAQRQTFVRASSAFESFCHDWERLLRERELNNLEHLSWRQDGTLQTATYTGYGKVEACECKESKEGLPIGKIRYEEMNYSIAGKTIDEAKHAAPKMTHEISTLEIFSWDKGKWFY
jgi:hypothetical protein